MKGPAWRDSRKVLFSVVEDTTLDQLKDMYLIFQLRRHNWNRADAARALGVDKKTVWSRMKALGITTRVVNEITPEISEAFERLVRIQIVEE